MIIETRLIFGGPIAINTNCIMMAEKTESGTKFTMLNGLIYQTDYSYEQFVRDLCK
jgi:hypothetical protein